MKTNYKYYIPTENGHILTDGAGQIAYSTDGIVWREVTVPSESASGLPSIEKVIFNDPATIVFWSDGTKTVVKCGERDKFDPEKGMAMAISKKALGNSGSYYDEFKEWCEPYWKEAEYPEFTYTPFCVREDMWHRLHDEFFERDFKGADIDGERD